MSDFINPKDIFASNVFSHQVMRERLPKNIYRELLKTIQYGAELQSEVADVVAAIMRDWAIEKGATHYTHWFQPMTGITAEKHDAFLSIDFDGRAILDFSGRELIRGESDASSFPSGGLRATFEARGYTAWDCTSPAFVREDAAGVTLVIPTAFCSYTGEALDKKTPLLRSMDAVNLQGLRLLRLFGNTKSQRVIPSIGPEQEYFLIDKFDYLKRKDLIFSGRTLFGAMPPKGQEMDDHYYGAIKERVAAFMSEANIEMWKLGIPAKTQHNEVAPAQHEIAPFYGTANIATDHNQLVMETLKKVADRHDLVCLLHEKPFAGVNGSGKHNNWSLGTDDGINLFNPGKKPHENLQFLLFLMAVIKAVDEHAPLLRLSAANAGNDHRLGSNEAPPAIISIFLGEQLDDILEQIEAGHLDHTHSKDMLDIGASSLPHLKRDATDRNRTSPFAFTGNKFEFRMVPSSASIATPNFILNTIAAEALGEFADILEAAEDFQTAVWQLIQDTVRKHKRVIFNGNGYSEEWVEEAKKRGLPNITNTVDSIPALEYPSTIAMFEKHCVLTRAELFSRAEIGYEKYIKIILIEARTMLQMTRKEILPVVLEYASSLALQMKQIEDANLNLSMANPQEQLKAIWTNVNLLYNGLEALEKAIKEADAIFTEDSLEQKAKHCRDAIVPEMEKLREPADGLELLLPKKVWPFPTYDELMFRV